MASESGFEKLISAAESNTWKDAAPASSNDVPTSLSHALLHAILHGTVLLIVLRVLKRTWTRATSEPTSNTSPFELDVTEREVENECRNNGEWVPRHFDYPEIAACALELKDIKPIPCRPFRWGEYHVTMGLRTMPWSEWIELDSTYPACQCTRSFRLRARGRNAAWDLPLREDGIIKVSGGVDAAKELVYELAEYLSRRYPTTFRVTRMVPFSAPVPSVGGIPLSWDGRPPICAVEIKETGVKFDLSVLDTLEGVEMGEEAMRIVTGLVQEDVAIMMEGSDGKYYFQAGSMCTPGFWRMDDKQHDKIHTSGNAPLVKERLERLFRRMTLDKPVTRNNYFIQVVKSSEEGYLEPATVRLRTERQTLRRLPRTGAIIFGIRTYVTKVDELGQGRGVAEGLARVIQGWPEGEYEDVLVGYLEDPRREPYW